jgi:Right handed beta helix region
MPAKRSFIAVRSPVRGNAALFAWVALSGCSHTGTPHREPASAPSGVVAGRESAAAGAAGHAGAVGLSAAASGAGAGSVANAGSQLADAGSNTDDAGGGNPGTTGSAGSATDPQAMDLIAAADGKDSAAGSLSEPTTLTAALVRIAAGHSIYLRGGTYALSDQVTIARDNSGSSADQTKQLRAYRDEKPILDFSKEPYGKDANPRGLELDGNYWHVQGLTVQGAADNGIYVGGSHNVIEDCVVHANRDTGLQLGRSGSSVAQADWPSNNLIVNCESYDNYDAPPGSGENADGFAAKLTVGSGNVFRGCESHNNIDDGWDLYTKSDTGPIGAVTIDQCISHHNGTLTNGMSSDQGDRNGFKLGGEDIAVAHVVTRSVAFANGKNGFTWNSNPGAIRLSNTLAFDNAAGNYSFGNSDTTTQAVFSNNVSFWRAASAAKSDKTLGSDAAQSNCWWTTSGKQPSQNANGLMVSAADFAAPLDDPKIARAADHSLDFSAFGLASGSDLINAGVVPDGDLPFDPASAYHGKPDLGAVENP